jgi:gliding motility-associated-like protein
MKNLFLVLALVASFLIPNSSKASHAAGGELVYEWVTGNTFRFTLKFYRDCTGINEPPNFGICYKDGCSNTVYHDTLGKVQFTLPGGGANGAPVSTGCSADTKCTNVNSVIPGFREWWYQNDITLPAQCNNWTFWVSESARNTVNNLTGGNLYISAFLNNFDAPTNSSAQFTFQPVPYLCLNQFYTYNNGAYDPDGDSLVFESIQPQTSNSTAGTGTTSCTNPGIGNVAYSLGTYNPLNNPMACSLFAVNPNTGLVQVTPTALGLNVVTVKVSEYRNGILVGEVRRDIQIATINCNITYPSSALNTTTVGNLNFNINTLYYEACPLDTVTFCVLMTGPIDTANISVVTNANTVLTGSLVSITGYGTDSALACVAWIPGILDTGLHVVSVNYRDTNCTYNVVAPPNSFTLPIYVLPTLKAYGDTTICNGDTAKSLLAIGGTAFTWKALPGGSPNSSLSCLNCKNPKAWPSVTTSYEVTSNVASTCSGNKDTVTVYVYPSPVVNLGADFITCHNSTYTITPIITPVGNYTYQWTPGTFLANPVTSVNQVVQFPTSNQTYILKVTPVGTGGAACATRDTIVMTALQKINIVNADTTICAGAAVNIVTAGNPLYAYLWSPVKNVSNIVVRNPIITPDSTRKYVITASYPGCPDQQDSITLTVEPLPIVNAGLDRILCYGDTMHLFGQVAPPNADPNFYTYAWSPVGNVNPTDELESVFSGKATTTLTLTVTTPAGCAGVDQVIAQVVPVNFLVVSADKTTCPNDTAKFSASGAISYNWSPGIWVNDSTNKNISAWPIATTIFTLVGTDINGCRDTNYRTFTIMPSASVNLGVDQTIYPGQSAQLYAQGNCSYYTWTPITGLNFSNIQDPIAQPSVTQQYVVNASTEFGCKTSDTIEVNVVAQSLLGMPIGFTPGNGNSPNNLFKVDKLGLATLNYLRVFDRWGVMVYESTDLNAGWDGSFKGKPQPMATYIFTVDAVSKDGSKFHKIGNVTLIR